jgi:hypothetical protein
MGVPQKLKIEGPYDLAAPFLGIYLNEIKWVCKGHVCTAKFIVAPFTTAKKWKQPKCPSTE